MVAVGGNLGCRIMRFDATSWSQMHYYTGTYGGCLAAWGSGAASPVTPTGSKMYFLWI